MVDTLHTLALGVFKSFVHCTLWKCIDANIYGLGPRLTEPEVQITSCMRLKSDLFEFYAKVRESGDHSLSELGDLTIDMLGPRDSVTIMRSKGAESEGVLRFVVDLLLPKNADKLENGCLLLGAATALWDFQKSVWTTTSSEYRP